MEANLENAIETLRRVAETYLTDDLGHLRSVTTAGHQTVAILDAAGEIETHELKDHHGNVINRKLRLKRRGDNESRPLTAVESASNDDPDLAARTRNACAQLTRYGGAVATPELAAVLEALTDLNDNLHHDRAAMIGHAQVRLIIHLLYVLAEAEGFDGRPTW